MLLLLFLVRLRLPFFILAPKTLCTVLAIPTDPAILVNQIGALFHFVCCVDIYILFFHLCCAVGRPFSLARSLFLCGFCCCCFAFFFGFCWAKTCAILSLYTLSTLKTEPHNNSTDTANIRTRKYKQTHTVATNTHRAHTHTRTRSQQTYISYRHVLYFIYMYIREYIACSVYGISLLSIYAKYAYMRIYAICKVQKTK